jgi:signal transduction histidine kinase
MTKPSPHNNGSHEPQSVARRALRTLFYSRALGAVVNLPPIAWLTKRLASPIIARQLAEARRAQAGVQRPRTAERASPAPGAAGMDGVSADTLHSIVMRVVDSLGYIGAMIATYEQGDVLPVRAFYVDSRIADAAQIRAWEDEVSRLTGLAVRITDPNTARVYRYDPAHRANLSIVAVERGGPAPSRALYDLFTPILPLAARPIVESIQGALGIVEVIAVPFFNYVHTPDGVEAELVGNLFAAKNAPISAADTLVLSALGQQAASLLEGERRQSQARIIQDIIYGLQVSLHDERALLQRIAGGIVRDLGYPIAVVGTKEPDDTLVIGAVDLDPAVVTPATLDGWERALSRAAGTAIRLLDERVVRVNLRHEAHRDNISVQAVRRGEAVTSDSLYDWFRPVIPPSARPIADSIQEVLGLRQLIAIPIYSTHLDGARALVGTLVVGTRSRRFTRGEVELLSTFGAQAAVGIRNARLYRTAEQRRVIAQTFAKRAFTAAAATHYLNGHVGFAYSNLSLLKSAALLPEGQREEVTQKVMDNVPGITQRLHSAKELLRQLDTPFKLTREDAADLNWCVRVALDKAPGGMDYDQLHSFVAVEYAEALPQIYLSSDMLIAALNAIVDNAIDALRQRDSHEWHVGIATRLSEDGRAVQIAVRDNGDGIPDEHQARIFEMGFTTKRNRLGFGLFWTKDFIEGLGGSIHVESRRGLGTTVTLTIPVIPPPPGATSQAEVEASTEISETQPSRPEAAI